MALIGKPIDRIDGRLKVTGAAKYAAEFRVPDVVHAVLVQSTIAAGSITGFELAEAQGMPGVLAIITPDNAGKLSSPSGLPQAVGGPLLQDRDILFNGQHVAVVVARTLDQALAAAARVQVRYANGEAATLDGRAARPSLHAEEFPQRRTAARLEPGRSGWRFQYGRDQAGCDLHHPRSSTTTRWSRMQRSLPGMATS